MQVVLMERIEKLGQMGDVVNVKPGYARNFLLPQKKALRATKDNLARFEQERAQLEAQNLERRQEAEKVAESMADISVTLIRQAGESGQLYGSVTARDLSDAISQAGATVDRKQIVMDKVIKALGLHAIKVQLHPEVAITVSANVARSEEEATAQIAAGRMVSTEEIREAEEAAEAEIQAVVAAVEAEGSQDDEAESGATAESEGTAADGEEAAEKP